ncbi:MAG: c-type cytochrome [Steroidobacter sp.]
MKFRPSMAAFGLGLVLGAAAVSANADGDAKRGEVLAYTCHGCHGVPNYKNAYPNYSVPRLGGQSAPYLVTALKAYAAGERPHQTMHSQAVTLSDQDRQDIAAYIQGERVQPGAEVVGTPPAATQTCVACHGADGAKTIAPEYPVLAGQYADYIVQALRDYKNGKRKNPVMVGIVAGVDEKDFEALGQFFARQPGLCSTDEIREHGKCGK